MRTDAVARTNRLTLSQWSLSSVVWYLAVASGWPLLIFAAVRTVMDARSHTDGSFFMVAGLIVLLELLPLVQGRGHDPNGVVMSSAFVCAMLISWGPWPAIVMQGIATLTSDVRARKNWRKWLFNPAQQGLSWMIAELVASPLHGVGSMDHPLGVFHLHDLLWVVAVCGVYFLANLSIVVAVLSYAGPFWELFVDDFGHYSLMTFSVLSMAPLVAVVAHQSWPLLPLLVVPLMLLYYTAQMALQREHAAGHDALTGLPNRSTLTLDLADALEAFEAFQRPFALMLIDMDDFKRVNDTLGHQAGDALLREVGARLSTALRESDRAARLGGDEFAVLVQDADEAVARQVATRISDVVAQPVSMDGVTIEIGLSVGVALCPEHGTDATALLQRADVAMYVAKADHTRIELYAADRDKNSTDALALLGELRRAIDDGVLELHYQPKVSTSDQSVVGLEALIRWPHPTRGWVPPDEFIPLAESAGLVQHLTGYVIRSAIAQAAQWHRAGIGVPVAVNIAPSDLLGDSLLNQLMAGLVEFELPPEMLQLEITERMRTEHAEETLTTLHRLRGLGIAISLDDFGTGYSSLLRLGDIPVDEIKIDGIFVQRLGRGRDAIGIMRTLVGLARSLEVPLIAEGVETDDQLALLTELGCDAVQGWFVCRPLVAAEAGEWLRTRMVSRSDPARRGPEHAGVLGA